MSPWPSGSRDKHFSPHKRRIIRAMQARPEGDSAGFGENRAIARRARKIRRSDFHKAEAKLVLAAVPGRAPRGLRRHCFRARSGYIRAPCRQKSWRTQVFKGLGIKEKGFCLHLLSPKPPLPRAPPR